MKPYLPFLFICGAILPMHAEELVTIMKVNTPDGTESVEVTTQSRITFSKDLNMMIVADGNTSRIQSFDVDDIVSIDFIFDSTVNVEEAALDELKVSNSGKVLTISGADTIEYGVWDMSGLLIVSGSGSGNVSIDFNDITPGVYIIKANKSIIKYLNH